VQTRFDICRFHDYRELLAHLVLEKKRTQKNFSYQSFANKFGTSKSYLKLVVDKKRHIHMDKISSLCDFFGFNSFEREFFLFLFLKNVSEDPWVRDFFTSIQLSYVAQSDKSSPNSSELSSFLFSKSKATSTL